MQHPSTLRPFDPSTFRPLDLYKHMKNTNILLVIFALLCVFSTTLKGQSRWWSRAQQIPGEREVIITHVFPEGQPLEIIFDAGTQHNHPLMAIWIEDMEGNYLQTLYVAESIGKGVFRHGDASSGRWLPGPIRRPAALPYWGHQRGVQAEDGYYTPSPASPIPDALTGPTPKSDFMVQSQIPSDTSSRFRVLFEINQSWDWNEYWTNNKYPSDMHYMTSSQPSLIYEASIDLGLGEQTHWLQPIGHGHWSGQNGNLYKDLSTITTALHIAASIQVRIPNHNK